MTPPRILLCGDVLGCLNQLFKRVQSVNKSAGPFDALFCVGQFFPESSDGIQELSHYLDGNYPVPMPIYFTGDYGFGAAQTLSKALVSTSNQGFKPDGIEICHNIYWLRGSGKFYLKGLSVAYLSGRQQLLAGQAIGMYSEDDVGALRALSEDTDVIDIFLTNEWPYGVSNKADTENASQGVSDPSGCDPVIAELVAELKPRYHIAGTKNIFFAREPYLNDKVAHATRFIGLGSVGNKNKEKFLYALSPTPASSMSPSEISLKPPNTTSSPFQLVNKTSHPMEAAKRLNDNGDNSQYWRYNVPQKRLKPGDDKPERLCFTFTSTGSCNRGEKCNFRHDEESREHYLRNICFDFWNKGICERGVDCRFRHRLSEEDECKKDQTWSCSALRRKSEKKCWFCLSSPDVESHLLISIADSFYCALAKGPLVQDHALLIPVEHKPTTLFLPPEVDAELGKYKSALKMYYKKLGKGVVFYETVSEHTTHANIQAVPVPLSRVSHVQHAFKLASKRLGFEFTTLTLNNESDDATELLREQSKRSAIYFYVEMPDGSLFVNSDTDHEKIPIQFGREVLAGMLNVADRADWRNCKLSKEDEIKMADGFKDRFKEFDPA